MHASVGPLQWFIQKPSPAKPTFDFPGVVFPFTSKAAVTRRCTNPVGFLLQDCCVGQFWTTLSPPPFPATDFPPPQVVERTVAPLYSYDLSIHVRARRMGLNVFFSHTVCCSVVMECLFTYPSRFLLTAEVCFPQQWFPPFDLSLIQTALVSDGISLLFLSFFLVFNSFPIPTAC